MMFCLCCLNISALYLLWRVGVVTEHCNSDRAIHGYTSRPSIVSVANSFASGCNEDNSLDALEAQMTLEESQAYLRFMQYLQMARAGVEIGGVLITNSVVVSLAYKLGTSLLVLVTLLHAVLHQH